jgi:Cu/Ag efflux pump CusA
MTSLTLILAVLPLVFATGAGQAGRHSVGTTLFGGMFFATFLNVVFIPVLYVVVRSLVPGRAEARSTALDTAGGAELHGAPGS